MSHATTAVAAVKLKTVGDSAILAGLLADKNGVAHNVSPLLDVDIIEAASALTAAGVPVELFGKITGFGGRRCRGCHAEDTILNKFAAGALSIYGVMGVLYGTDSPSHHAGRVITAVAA